MNELNIISGPCSIESEELTFSVFKELSENKQVRMLRGGVWKPRTKPGAFEGIGAIGLKWMIEAGNSVNLPVTTEVANKEHVELALEAGFKNLWIGARTSVNPFTVQEIADALKGANDVSILVKNPVNPDLKLWIGAIERILSSGVKKVGAIHRGFSVYGEEKYRNAPIWNIPLSLKQELGDIELICDPSHIAGKRELLHEISQEALNLNFDGLMIESHLDPSKALSDAQQQITPVELEMMLINLSLRNVNSENESFNDELAKLRLQIDNLDEKLMNLLGQRMNLAEEIGEFKKENNIVIYQMERWKEILTTRSDMGINLNLSNKFILQYLDAIHEESIKKQNKILNK